METSISSLPPRPLPDGNSNGSSSLAGRGQCLNLLPAQPSPLVGRDEELRKISDRLLQADVRLLTLTGPGGVGKTRLALAVAEQARERFADGVAFVDLSPLPDARPVVSAVAAVLGLCEGGRRSLAEIAQCALRERELLLVLDNFEHVLGAAAELGELLASCLQLKVLVTSREPLGLRWEHEFPVGPLPLPPAGDSLTPEALAAVPAVALFVWLAQKVRPSFALSAANAQDVAEICRRLDGLPLALELATARLRMMSPAALLARLEQRLDLLAARVPDAPARHQTLRESIRWSYDLLSPAEQAEFRRLAVFDGGWTIAGATLITDPGLVAPIGEMVNPDLDVFDGLASLVEKSLVHQAGSGDEARFGMLETVREFGLARLGAAGEVDEIRRRHAEYYLAVAEEAEQQLLGPRQAVWLDRLSAEHDNLRAALRWAAERDPQLGLRLAAALWRFWDIRGYLSEGREQLARLLALPETRAPTAARAAALDGQSVLARQQGDYAVARALQEESLTIRRQFGDRRGIAQSLSGRGEVAPAPGSDAVADALKEDEHVGLLSPREREVAALIARGRTSRGIAEELVVSVKTADSHADHIRTKLGLRSRSEIAAWAVAHGLYTPSR